VNPATAQPRLPFHSRKKAFLHLINSGRALQIAEGETIEIPEKAHRVLEERTNPTRPMFRISMARARSATPTR
jgi:hypothetical protein